MHPLSLHILPTSLGIGVSLYSQGEQLRKVKQLAEVRGHSCSREELGTGHSPARILSPYFPLAETQIHHSGSYILPFRPPSSLLPSFPLSSLLSFLRHFFSCQAMRVQSRNNFCLWGLLGPEEGLRAQRTARAGFGSLSLLNVVFTAILGWEARGPPHWFQSWTPTDPCLTLGTPSPLRVISPSVKGVWKERWTERNLGQSLLLGQSEVMVTALRKWKIIMIKGDVDYWVGYVKLLILDHLQSTKTAIQ